MITKTSSLIAVSAPIADNIDMPPSMVRILRFFAFVHTMEIFGTFVNSMVETSKITVKNSMPITGGGYLDDNIVQPSMVLSREIPEAIILGRGFLHTDTVFGVERENDRQ